MYEDNLLATPCRISRGGMDKRPQNSLANAETITINVDPIWLFISTTEARRVVTQPMRNSVVADVEDQSISNVNRNVNAHNFGCGGEPFQRLSLVPGVFYRKEDGQPLRTALSVVEHTVRHPQRTVFLRPLTFVS